MTPERQIVVVKQENGVIVPHQQVDRRFLLELRRATLQQLAVIEKQLEITKRCPNCAYEIK